MQGLIVQINIFEKFCAEQKDSWSTAIKERDDAKKELFRFRAETMYNIEDMMDLEEKSRETSEASFKLLKVSLLFSDFWEVR